MSRPPGGIDGEPRTVRLVLLVSPAELEQLRLAALAADPPARVSVWARDVVLRAATKNASETRT